MKKLLLTLGAIASVTAPIAAVVACGADKPATTPEQNAGGSPNVTNAEAGLFAKDEDGFVGFVGDEASIFSNLNSALQIIDDTFDDKKVLKVELKGDLYRIYLGDDSPIAYRITLNQKEQKISKIESHTKGIDGFKDITIEEKKNFATSPFALQNIYTAIWGDNSRLYLARGMSPTEAQAKCAATKPKLPAVITM